MERESMVFYRSFYEAIVGLPDVELAQAFRAIAEYGLNGIETECSGTAKVALIMAKPQIDKNNMRYANGCKGGRPAENLKPNDNQIKPSDNQTITNQEPNVNVNDNVNDIKKKDTKVSKEKAHFVPPTLENVIGYCQEKGYKVDAHRFIDFYESKGWMVGKNKMKDWKAALRNWARQDNAKVVDKPVKTKFHNFQQRSYDSGDLDKLFANQ